MSCHTRNVLECDDDCVVECVDKLREYRQSWRIVEPRRRSTATTSQMQHIFDTGYCPSNKDRQNLVVELARCGKTPDEVEQIVTRLFDNLAATTTSRSAVAVLIQISWRGHRALTFLGSLRLHFGTQ